MKEGKEGDGTIQRDRFGAAITARPIRRLEYLVQGWFGAGTIRRKVD